MRWRGEPGRRDRGPEGRARHPARGVLSGVGCVAGLVLQVAQRGSITAAPATGRACRSRRDPVRQTSRQLRLTPDHRGPAGSGVAGQLEHRRGGDGRAAPGGQGETLPPIHHQGERDKLGEVERRLPRVGLACGAGQRRRSGVERGGCGGYRVEGGLGVDRQAGQAVQVSGQQRADLVSQPMTSARPPPADDHGAPARQVPDRRC